MKQIFNRDYFPPQIVVYGLVCEGQLCQSGEENFRGNYNGDYMSDDDLYEIF